MSENKKPVVDVCCVGLDLSLTGTGFSMKCGDEYKLELIKTNPKTASNDLARLCYIRDKIMAMIPSHVSMIAIEDFFIPHSSLQINACKSLIMLGTLVRTALYERVLPIVIVSPTSLKKFATGKGTGPKGIVIREVYRLWGIEAKNDDNVADSVVLAHMAQAVWRNANNESLDYLLKYQQEAIRKVIGDRPYYNFSYKGHVEQE